ncbi:hypothetical protein ACF3MZ_23250 [Paenibacillaceae bacterium WGS1546]|uniref:hypothetical protein n=1 Tax=Cohnella sp. WGS1546 TaxID=3366810 RepID=UPI00372D6700
MAVIEANKGSSVRKDAKNPVLFTDSGSSVRTVWRDEEKEDDGAVERWSDGEKRTMEQKSDGATRKKRMMKRQSDGATANALHAHAKNFSPAVKLFALERPPGAGILDPKET